MGRDAGGEGAAAQKQCPTCSLPPPRHHFVILNLPPTPPPPSQKRRRRSVNWCRETPARTDASDLRETDRWLRAVFTCTSHFSPPSWLHAAMQLKPPAFYQVSGEHLGQINQLLLTHQSDRRSALSVRLHLVAIGARDPFQKPVDEVLACCGQRGFLPRPHGEGAGSS